MDPTRRTVALSAAASDDGLGGSLFALMEDAVLLARYPDRRILDVNDAFLRLFQLTRAEALALTTEAIHVDAAHFARFGVLVGEHMRRGERLTVEWPFRRRDGSVFTGEITLSPAHSGSTGNALSIIRDVSRDRESRRQMELQAQVLESMAEGVRLATEDGVVVYTNAAEDAMFGCERGGLLGKHMTAQNAAPPEAARKLMAAIAAALRKRGKWEGEFENVRKDGTRFFTHARITRLELDGKRHWLCVQEDVTERKRLAERERANTRALATLVAVQEELARNLDLERVVQAATDAARSVSGAEFGAFFYNVTDARGERYTLYTLSGAKPEEFAAFGMPRNTAIFSPTFHGEGIVRSADITKDPRYGKNAPHHGMPEGHRAVRSYLAVPVVSRDGSVHGGLFLGHAEAGRFSAAAEDIVATIAAQAAIAIDNATLYRRAKESEERWRRLVDNAPVQILTIDPAGRIRTLNRSLRAAEPSRLAGTDVYSTIVADDRARVRGIIEGVMRTGEPTEYETRGIISESDIRWFQVRVAPLDDGGERGAVLISTDVTQRKRDEAEFAIMRAQLIQGEKLAALGSLVSGVAHELRTPLTFLANNAFLAQHRLTRAAERGASAAEAVAETTAFLSEIMTGIDRINLLVEDLRRYTRTRRDAEVTTAPLPALIADAVELFRAANRSKHLIETLLSPTVPVRGNKGAIQQLVLNLLQNAAEASPIGKPLRIVTRDSTEGPVLEVIDEGAGIPTADLDHIYEPLFTTKSEGTGLGLSIVRRIVEEHRARIACHTEVGRGTRFVVTFPPA